MKPALLSHCRIAEWVAPRRGAWVETSAFGNFTSVPQVAPRRGAWVETGNRARVSCGNVVAPRRGAWVETGVVLLLSISYHSRTPQGCVG